jgi:hypothetical protein
LLYSTFWGADAYEEGYGVAVDSSGAAYIVGHTYSSDFPTTLGAFDTTFNGGYSDAFVAKLAMRGGRYGISPMRG